MIIYFIMLEEEWTDKLTVLTKLVIKVAEMMEPIINEKIK